MLLTEIKKFSDSLLSKINNKKVKIISHFDTDGITSAAILSKTLERRNLQFSVKIIKSLSDKEIKKFPNDSLIILLDLGSGSIKELASLNRDIIIIDHHEPSQIDIPENILIFNPHLYKDEYEDLCTAELCSLISNSISKENIDLSKLAILGMVGDTMEKNISKIRNLIITNADVKIKKGLLIYPSTRPIDKALEFSSRPFIPGVTGDPKGTYELLREAEIEKTNKNYKALIDLDDSEMKRLVTAVTLRLALNESTDYIGNLYLIKFFNKIEDARELSAMINACSRMDKPEIALMLCLGNTGAKKKAQKVYIKYRQHIISGLRHIDKNKKIEGREYVIINAKDSIKDTIIGTLASILSFSSVYKEGTIIVAMAYNEDKIKVSTRMSGRSPKIKRNLKELMESITSIIGGESGGHKRAAGCVIDKKDEQKFIELLQKKLEVELIKI
ncbi:DHH family phosphoesterase [Candidatus Pacearchaeota archaeon]|nr:DHH family phosphoesterase [Candidatus Pacearchaeota archaeon]